MAARSSSRSSRLNSSGKSSPTAQGSSTWASTGSPTSPAPSGSSRSPTELPAAFPSLRSLSTRRHNLPVASSSFIGREQESAAVTDLVRSSRMVTLVGIGGVGKTRLALQVAAGLIEDHPDGVFFVDLAPLADPGLVGAQVGRAIGMVEPQTRNDRTGPSAKCDF